jgi:hypothetical protein
MTAADMFDTDSVVALSRRTDEVGVVSIYVNADPLDSPNLEGSAIDLRNRLRELERRVADGGPPERARRVAAALDRLAPEVASLTGRGQSGRGRMLFAALGHDWVTRLSSPMPVNNRVVLDDGPFIHPLLEILDEGLPAGVVLASPTEAQLMEWRLGELRPLSRLAAETVEAPHERSGPIGGGPSGRFGAPVREQRQARGRDLAERFALQVAAVATRLAAERRWVRVVVSGGERLTRSLVDGFPESLRHAVVSDARVLGGLDRQSLTAAVTERLHDAYTEGEAHLLGRLRDAAFGGTAALGPSEVVAALNAGRVAHLVYDPKVRYSGSVASTGDLFAGDEVAGAAEAVAAEPRLTERLVERALETGARVSPVEGAADGVLQEAAGIAALLRW